MANRKYLDRTKATVGRVDRRTWTLDGGPAEGGQEEGNPSPSPPHVWYVLLLLSYGFYIGGSPWFSSSRMLPGGSTMFYSHSPISPSHLGEDSRSWAVIIDGLGVAEGTYGRTGAEKGTSAA